MEYNYFVSLVKKAKKSPKHTAQILNRLEISGTGDKKYLNKITTCKTCGHIKNKTIAIRFNAPKSLTIFEAGLLWALFAENKLPADYAQYHKCKSGKEFIESIKNVEN